MPRLVLGLRRAPGMVLMGRCGGPPDAPWAYWVFAKFPADACDHVHADHSGRSIPCTFTSRPTNKLCSISWSIEPEEKTRGRVVDRRSDSRRIVRSNCPTGT
eukprot:988699-Pyramimonas_sp.AAC.1